MQKHNDSCVLVADPFLWLILYNNSCGHGLGYQRTNYCANKVNKNLVSLAETQKDNIQIADTYITY